MKEVWSAMESAAAWHAEHKERNVGDAFPSCWCYCPYCLEHSPHFDRAVRRQRQERDE